VDTIAEQDGCHMHEDLVNQPCLDTLTGKAGTDDQQIRGLRLVRTETRNRNQDKWASGEVKSFSAIDFRGFEEDEQTSTSLFGVITFFRTIFPAKVSKRSGREPNKAGSLVT